MSRPGISVQHSLIPEGQTFNASGTTAGHVEPSWLSSAVQSSGSSTSPIRVETVRHEDDDEGLRELVSTGVDGDELAISFRRK